MTDLFLLILLFCVDKYCEATDTPGCKAVHNAIEKMLVFTGLITLIAIVVGILYYFIK